MRLVYLGTPAEAVPTLLALVEAGHEVVLAVTQPDRKRGRGGDLSPSPVKVAAQELGIPVSHKVSDVTDVQADYGVVVVFGRLIKPDVLAHLTFLNLHPSLLPRWRGATPAESAILAGDTETGVCLMQLDEGMDTGPVYDTIRTSIDATETAPQLLRRLLNAGTDMLIRNLSQGLPEPQPQQGEPTYAPKLQPDDLRIDWDTTADEVLRKVRIGRAWTTFRGKRLRIVSAQVAEDSSALQPGEVADITVGAGAGALVLVEVQPEGKAAQPARSWANGARLAPGERLD